MEQEITVSKDIVRYFFENMLVDRKNPTLNMPKYRLCYDLLKRNLIVLDKSNIHRENIVKEIEKLPNTEEANVIRKSLVGLMVDNPRFINFEIFNSDIYLFELCSKSDDKIYFDPLTKEKTLEELRRKELEIKFKIGEVEILNLDYFLDPDHTHKLKNIPTEITLQQNMEYDLGKILLPFLRNANYIILIDPFLPNPIAKSNLVKLFKIFNKNAEIILVFYSRSIYLRYSNKENEKQKKEDYENLQDFIKKMKDKKIKVCSQDIEKTGHKERYILTDKYKIRLPGGLDSIGSSKHNRFGFRDEYTILEIGVNFIDEITKTLAEKTKNLQHHV